jgi:hypothetical protein
MDWQLAIVVMLVAAASFYLGRQGWRSWLGRKLGCGGSCSCPSASTEERSDASETPVVLIPPDQIHLRRPGPRAL